MQGYQQFTGTYNDAWRLLEQMEDKSHIGNIIFILSGNENEKKNFVHKVFENISRYGDLSQKRSLSSILAKLSCKYGYLSYVQYLLNTGSIQDNVTSVIISVRGGYIDIVKLFLFIGDIKRIRKIALEYAAEFNQVEIIKYLISIDTNIDAGIALALSSYKNNYEVVTLLVNNYFIKKDTLINAYRNSIDNKNDLMSSYLQGICIERYSFYLDTTTH